MPCTSEVAIFFCFVNELRFSKTHCLKIHCLSRLLVQPWLRVVLSVLLKSPGPGLTGLYR